MAIKNPSAIGQAINLAAADARELGRQDDVHFIWKRYIFWEYLCKVIQDSDSDMIQEVIDSKNFDDVMKLLKEAFEEKK